MKKIATHKQPDADALAALYLAERFLFTGEDVEIAFVSRGAKTDDATCVVDVGNQHDPARLRFDHKPPAFADRNESCATRLLWEHLRGRFHGRNTVPDMELLADWVAVVHEGDANPPRSPSPALKQSRADGYHAAVAEARKSHSTDAAVYEAVRDWLDAAFQSV